MKLVYKITLRYFLFSFLILVLLGTGINFVLKIIAKREIDEKLENTVNQVEKSIEHNQQITSIEPFVTVMQRENGEEFEEFSDTSYQQEQGEIEEYRQLTAVKKINDRIYRITVRESELESDDLMGTISVFILLSLILLFCTLILLNIRISNSVWSTFYTNLDRLKMFSLTDLKPFHPEESNVLEFNELNQALSTLTKKVIDDYGVLKRFSEDASHELQTPIAVIRSKIETLMEENGLKKTQIDKIKSIYDSVNMLASINRDLLMLTKIDNNQFSNNETISLKNSVEEKIEYFMELTQIKNLKTEFEFLSDWIINADKNLVDILLDNLFTNAIKHNIPGGKIMIRLEDAVLAIANSGEKPVKNRALIFERFHKESGSGSTGLGLAIARQICKALRLQIQYDFDAGRHIFTIRNES